MTIEENKAIAKRFVEEIWNKKNLSILKELIAPDCPHHMNGPVNFRSQADYQKSLQSWFKAIPDIHVTIEDEIAEGDKVVTRGKTTGTHQGDMQFAGWPKAIPPTGKKIESEYVNIVYVRNGKIVEMWDTADFLWIQQLRQS